VINMLPALTPNPDRGARVVAKCHAKLAQQRRQITAAKRRAAAIERASAAALCMIYAAAVIFNALRMMAHT
jgi:hypothetical protein